MPPRIRFLFSWKPSGSRRSAANSGVSVLRPGSDCSAATVVTVANVRVVLAAVLFPVKARLVGAKRQDAPVGKVPQAKVTVPV